MELTGLSPSPKLGEIIEALKEAQLNSEVMTYEEAKEFINDYTQRAV